METLSKEQLEIKHESREVKEKEIDPELLAAMAAERAEMLVEASKTSTQMMQNIAQNIAQVKNVIAQIRATLGIGDDGTVDPSSVVQDQTQLAKLQKKILDYKKELITFKKEEIKKQKPQISEENLNLEAEQAIELLLAKTNT